jgi:hypothetical protein
MSTEHFVAKSLVEQLQLPRKKLNSPIFCRGLSNNAQTLTHFATLTLSRLDFTLTLNACIVSEICRSATYLLPADLRLLRTGGKKPVQPVASPVDVILSAAATWQVMTDVTPCPPPNDNWVMVKTRLGSCAVPLQPKEEASAVTIIANKDLEKMFSRFYSLELIGIAEQANDERRAEEVEAETMLKERAYFKDGAWVMPLLFKPEARPLRNNVRMAERRLISLERKLAQDPKLREDYHQEIRSLLELGTARPLREDEMNEEFAFYLPHRPIVKPERETTKIRPVFDASAKNADGLSLNSEILATPVLHPPLTGILLRFRYHRIALTGDISKMFHRMRLPPEHEKYHRFLFREKDTDPIGHFCFTKMAFGLADSPFKALRGVQMHVEKFKDDFPLAAAELGRNLYVDDLLSGTDKVEEALALQKDAVQLMAKAGLPIRKWCSSDAEVMKGIPEAERGALGRHLLTSQLQDEQDCEVETRPSSSALGVEWFIEGDTLRYTGFSKMNLPEGQCTKREVVAAVASFFDPLGLIAPFIISAKILIQRLWKRSLDWDEALPADVLAEWHAWTRDVPHLDKIWVPRCFRSYQRLDSRESSHRLILFCDASEAALGAAVYIRVAYDDGHVEVHLLMAKSKVSPLKDLTLPRKELAAAVLGTKLLQHVATELDMNPTDAFCFSDSMTTLQWLRRHPRQWKVWVANRVAQVQAITDSAQWRHVAGLENPADLPSRGVAAEALADNGLWFHGPWWLLEDPKDWPQEETDKLSVECMEESRTTEVDVPTVGVALAIQGETYHNFFNHFWRTSGFRKYLRLTAFIRNWKKGRKPFYEKNLDWDTENKALIRWIRLEQRAAFPEYFSDESASGEAGRDHRVTDINCFTHAESVKQKGGRLQKLSPFVEKGLLGDRCLHVGGRLQDAPNFMETKTPWILPKCNPKSCAEINGTFTGRLIWQTHVDNQHAGAEWTLQFLRQRYWIMAGRASVRAVLRWCLPCQRAIKKLATQEMAPLPPGRLDAGTPWRHVGVDYTGAFWVKINADDKPVYGQGFPKAYVLIFTDLVTRGVHFEITMDMTVKTFFVAFRRFAARRGLPEAIYSDEARYFVRAKMELKKLFDNLDTAAVKAGLAEMGVKWELNTPRAPFRGGAWERLLRTFKETLRKVAGAKLMTLTEFQNVTVEIEAMMNDRPLCTVIDDPDATPITPAILMTGRPLRQLPPAAAHRPEVEPDATIMTHWKRRMNAINAAWRHFQKRYMREVLMPNTKWLRKNPSPPKKGQLVLLSTETTKRPLWPLARVVEVQPSRDGLPRTVVVRKGDGTHLTRAIQTLVQLEDDDSFSTVPENSEIIPSEAEKEAEIEDVSANYPEGNSAAVDPGIPSGAEPGRDPEEEDRDIAQPDGMGPSARPDGPGSAPRRSGRRRRPPKWFY